MEIRIPDLVRSQLSSLKPITCFQSTRYRKKRGKTRDNLKRAHLVLKVVLKLNFVLVKVNLTQV